MKVIATILVVLFIAVITEAGLQRVKVVGKLICGSKPYGGAVIKLVDEDTGPDPDDTMARIKSPSSGIFTIEGQTSEISSIEPRLKIYHDCDDWKPCQRKLKYKVPKKYINEGMSGNKVFDIGTIQLETKMKGEERDCIH